MLKGIVARDSFEMEYVDILQLDCDRSIEQTKAAFDNACMLCSLYGRVADCDACPIKEAAKVSAEWHGKPGDWFEEDWVPA